MNQREKLSRRKNVEKWRFLENKKNEGILFLKNLLKLSKYFVIYAEFHSLSS